MDILIDDTGLMFKNGDLLVAESDEQHIEHIFEATKGSYYSDPLIGVGIRSIFSGPLDSQRLKQEIKSNLMLDNYDIFSIFVSKDFEIEVNAQRKI